MPAGEPGLVYMRMGTSTFDYHKDQDKTLASRARGMFTVGDIGYLDPDGYLYLCDRKGDMIISGGVNIYPAEIEAELSCHPAVADVAVFGIPHEEWGEEIKAVVQPAARPHARPGPDRGAAGLPRRPDRPVQAAQDRSTTSPNCRATPTASSTSAASAIRTGLAATAKSKNRKRYPERVRAAPSGSRTTPTPVNASSPMSRRQGGTGHKRAVRDAGPRIVDR